MIPWTSYFFSRSSSALGVSRCAHAAAHLKLRQTPRCITPHHAQSHPVGSHRTQHTPLQLFAAHRDLSHPITCHPATRLLSSRNQRKTGRMESGQLMLLRSLPTTSMRMVSAAPAPSSANPMSVTSPTASRVSARASLGEAKWARGCWGPGQVGAVLTRDAGDQGGLPHGQPAPGRENPPPDGAPALVDRPLPISDAGSNVACSAEAEVPTMSKEGSRISASIGVWAQKAACQV